MPPSEHRAPLDATAKASAAGDDLRYEIQLWTLPGDEVERVLGRAATANLARAIYDAACAEHLGRRLTLRHGDDVINDTH